MNTSESAQHPNALPLRRETFESGPVPSVRIVHLGLGAFHRAHQAWYTQKSDPHGLWGIAAFTGRTATAAEQLSSQGGLYTLITRGPEQDTFEVMTPISEAHNGASLSVMSELISKDSTAVITLTVTEAGYHLTPHSDTLGLDTEDETVAHDIASLKAHHDKGTFDLRPGGLGDAGIRSAAARIVVGLAARRAEGSGPLAIVSCDNLPQNGTAARTAVVETAHAVDKELAQWIASEISFVDSSIDRITPQTTQADQAAVVEATAWRDRMPVVTEPFSSWVMSGEFPAGRPPWEDAGAKVVNNIEPFERRKLWLLNGAHSLMSYTGQLRGLTTVAEALDDPVVSTWVEELWDAAQAHLTDPVLDIGGYRDALRQRFANPRIAHFLAQIGADGSVKLPVRAVPILRAEHLAGRTGDPALRMIAAWMDHVCSLTASGADIVDPAESSIRAAVAETHHQTASLLDVIDPELSQEKNVVAQLDALRGTFTD